MLKRFVILFVFLCACGTGGYWDQNDERHEGPYFNPRPYKKHDDRVMVIIPTLVITYLIIRKRKVIYEIISKPASV